MFPVVPFVFSCRIRTASVDIYLKKQEGKIGLMVRIRTASVDIYLGEMKQKNHVVKYSYSIC